VKRFHLAVRMARPPRWLLAACVLLAGASCRQQPAPGGGSHAHGPRPTPALAQGLFSAQHADLLAYAHGLQFDTTRPAMAAQHLVVPRGGRLEVAGKITVAPEIGAAAVAHDSMARGRFVARLTLSEPCPEAGLAAGSSYLWVDSAGGAFRAKLVPESDSASVRDMPLETRGACAARQSIAWIEEHYSPADTMIICVPCDCKLCCNPALLEDRLLPARVPEVRGRVGVRGR